MSANNFVWHTDPTPGVESSISGLKLSFGNLVSLLSSCAAAKHRRGLCHVIAPSTIGMRVHVAGRYSATLQIGMGVSLRGRIRQPDAAQSSENLAFPN